jgi:hypothetical protein
MMIVLAAQGAPRQTNLAGWLVIAGVIIAAAWALWRKMRGRS